MNLAFVAGVLAGTKSRSFHAASSPSTEGCCVVVALLASTSETATAPRRFVPLGGPFWPDLGPVLPLDNTNEYCRSRPVRQLGAPDVDPSGSRRSRRRCGSRSRRCCAPGTHSQHGGRRRMDRRIGRRTVAKGAGAVASAAALGLFKLSAEASGAPPTTSGNRVCMTAWAATSGSPWSSTASATRAAIQPNTQQEPRAKGVEKAPGESASAGSQVRSHVVVRGSRRRTLRVHRFAADRGPRGVPSHGRRVGRSWAEWYAPSTSTRYRNKSSRS